MAATFLQQTAAEDAAAWIRRLGVPDQWDPMAFVDLCEVVGTDEESALGVAARQIQWHEMLLLLRWTCADAVGLSAPPVSGYSVGGSASGCTNSSS